MNPVAEGNISRFNKKIEEKGDKWKQNQCGDKDTASKSQSDVYQQEILELLKNIFERFSASVGVLSASDSSESSMVKNLFLFNWIRVQIIGEFEKDYKEMKHKTEPILLEERKILNEDSETSLELEIAEEDTTDKTRNLDLWNSEDKRQEIYTQWNRISCRFARRLGFEEDDLNEKFRKERIDIKRLWRDLDSPPICAPVV